MSHSKSDPRVNTTARDLTPYSSSRECGGNLKIGVCLQFPPTCLHTITTGSNSKSIWRWASHAAHRGTNIGRQVTQQVCRFSRGTPVHLPFSVCSSEANIRSYPAWQLRYRGSHMISAGCRTRDMVQQRVVRKTLSRILRYHCRAFTSVDHFLLPFQGSLGHFFHQRCVSISLNSFLPLSQQLKVQLSLLLMCFTKRGIQPLQSNGSDAKSLHQLKSSP